MTESYLVIINGRETAKVKISDILMVERDRRRLHIVTAEKEYIYYEKLENVECCLDNRFYPCLKGCYINFERISHMSDQKIHFENGYTYDIGRANFIRTKQKYGSYLRRGI